MGIQDQETPNGWPLGLEIMNIRFRVVESLSAAAEPYSLHVPSASFSSFTSSNLDTEFGVGGCEKIKQSTASFFQDHSVPLGRLIGIRPGNGGRLYFANSFRFEEHARIAREGTHSNVSRGGREVDMCRGICIPILLGALVKMSRSKSKCKS
ncbi:hypothetical protein FEM48_Zijuj01G0159400 [Ziziphus jujuba var. spinosa]|uniref:Uncharacterized protein n=1 Tax=Ziziphus jujuba var. spinosa TaxID=714518 RepID=A0A978W265_ZIZJJ|nr:hypothetical protein FEM48_Zijuj01G0159400 [Ziziphus jujuba var. spinosa]